MHSLIYFGFLFLFVVTAILEIDHQLPESLKFLHGRIYEAYSFGADLAGAIFLVGIGWAVVRRYVQRPYRIRIKTKPDHAVILAMFGFGVTGFFTEALRIAIGPARVREVVVRRLSALLARRFVVGSTLHDADRWMWVVHVAMFFVFLVILPITMLRHMFTSPMNMYLKENDRPKGAMKLMPNLMETELESFGASVVEDFTWKQLFDTDAAPSADAARRCVRRTRRASPSTPRDRAEGRRGHDVTVRRRPRRWRLDPEITIAADSVFERITSEEIWACTSCKACDESARSTSSPRQDPRHAALPDADGVRLPAPSWQHVRSMENAGTCTA